MIESIRHIPTFHDPNIEISFFFWTYDRNYFIVT